MISDGIKEKALDLANEIMKSEEYIEMKAKEEIFANDTEAQALVEDFKRKQEEFMQRRMTGEMDQDLMDELTRIQNELNGLESLKNFANSYTEFARTLGEVVDVIGREIKFDFREIYRSCSC
jgi:cell fate (sporulation/competence/biofilm development) regulator YlbF (YheA/YmcA/DUF963 family)